MNAIENNHIHCSCRRASVGCQSIKVCIAQVGVQVLGGDSDGRGSMVVVLSRVFLAAPPPTYLHSLKFFHLDHERVAIAVHAPITQRQAGQCRRLVG